MRGAAALELVARLKAGEEAAYEEAVRIYGPRLLAVARRTIRNEEDARDAVQDALLRAFRGIQSFNGQSELGTWLHRIAVNSALMKLRARKSRPSAQIEDLLPQFHADGHRVIPENPWHDPEAWEAERAETRRAVRDAIDRLPEPHRTVLLLRDVEQLDTGETAELLEVSTAVVKTRLHRARQALRTLLEVQYREGAL